MEIHKYKLQNYRNTNYISAEIQITGLHKQKFTRRGQTNRQTNTQTDRHINTMTWPDLRVGPSEN